VYGVALARNFREYLLGIDAKPEYFFPLKNPRDTTEKIATWWANRWLLKRIEREDVLEELEKQRQTYPIRHGARVPLVSPSHGTLSLYADDML